MAHFRSSITCIVGDTYAISHGASYASMACVYGTNHQIPTLRVSAPWKSYAKVVITVEIACSYTFQTVFPPKLTEWRGERERKM